MIDNEESENLRRYNYQYKTIKRKTKRKNKRPKTVFYMKTRINWLKHPNNKNLLDQNQQGENKNNLLKKRKVFFFFSRMRRNKKIEIIKRKSTKDP